MGRGARRATILAIATAAVGCQLVVSSDAAQCKTDADCDARGGAFAKSVCIDELCLPESDRCLGRVAPIVEDRSKALRARIRFVSVADLPIPGVEVMVCAPRDEFCGNPVGPSAVTDSDGYVYVTVWKNFRGTLQLKTPPNSDLMKTKVHIFQAFEVDDPPDLVIPPEAAVHLVTRSLLAGQVGTRIPLDPNAGHVLGSTIDCTLLPRRGVSVSLSSDVKGEPLQFYFNESRSASITATETGAEGAFGYANVPEGPVIIESTIASLGRKSARVEIWINKDTISTFQLPPNFVPP